MLEDQEHILRVILNIADEEQPQAVLISGDVFDRTVAPTEALRLLNDFLDGLVRRSIKVFIISGNHDSADRLAFGSSLMNGSGVHISRVYDGQITPFELSDEYGEVNVFLLPFLKPVQIKRFFPDTEIATWTDAVRVVIEQLQVDETKRNILLAHQFVTGATTCESEELNVGGADNVDAEVFAPFDYVALGHLHGAQKIGRATLRYCGTPLKYSFSEVNHKKSVTVVELGDKRPVPDQAVGDAPTQPPCPPRVSVVGLECSTSGIANPLQYIVVREIPLVPKREMSEIRGKYLEVTSREFYQNLNTDDYYRITLTDEDDQPDATSKLRVIYPNLMRLDYDNKRTQTEGSVTGVADSSQYTPLELFGMLYETQNGQPISATQREFLNDVIEQVWNDPNGSFGDNARAAV